MASFNFPFHITKNTPAVANETQSNFDVLLAWILDNLIQKDGSVSMTGPLVLAPGEPAAPGHAANKAYVDAIIPVGTIWEYGGTSLPSDWLWCNGDTYTDGSQPRLAGAIGRNFTAPAVPAGSFQVPDKRQRVAVGADATDPAFALGKTNALTQRNWEAIQHSHTQAPHTHVVPAFTPVVTLATESAQHTHDSGARTGYDINGADREGLSNALVGGVQVTFVRRQTAITYNQLPAAGGQQNTGVEQQTHSHAVTVTQVPAVTLNEQTPVINNSGTVTNLTDRNLPPYVAVNYIIYAGPS